MQSFQNPNQATLIGNPSETPDDSFVEPCGEMNEHAKCEHACYCKCFANILTKLF